MNLRGIFAVSGALLAATVCTATSLAPERAGSLAIENVTIIDVERGQRLGARTVLIIGDRIARIDESPAARLPPGCTTLDGRGLFLVPGLVDMHVHLFNNSSHRSPNEWAFPLFIANGVTAVREMRTDPARIATVNRWREAVAEGQLIAPRVLAAGVAVKGTSPPEARREVRAAKMAGADFIKVFSDVPETHWRAILDEARRSGTTVCGHVPEQVSLLTAARAGQRTNEHLTQVYEACSSREKALLAARQKVSGNALIELCDAQEREVLETFEPRICAQVAGALARTRQVQVPTLVLPYFEARKAESDFRDDPRWRFLRADERKRWARILARVTAGDRALAAKRWEVSRQIFAALIAAKVPILAGTDTPMPRDYPGFSLHDELELFVACGMTPAEALRSATIGPAQFLGLTKSSGSIAIGKRADLLLVEADPLRRIDNLRRIRAVVLAGRLLRKSDLKALLRDTTN